MRCNHRTGIALVDEAADVGPEVWEAIGCLKPSRMVVLPGPPVGPGARDRFLRTVQEAADEANLSMNHIDPVDAPSDLVRLSWRDTHGKRPDGNTILPRHRAELLVEHFLGKYHGRFEMSIESIRPSLAEPPITEAPVKWALILGFLEAVLGFVKANGPLLSAVGAALGLLVLAALGIYLPTAHLRVVPVVVLGLVAFLLGFLANLTGSKPLL